jgi:hypothetical protein
MQDAGDFHYILLHAIDSQKRKAVKYEFAGAGLAAHPASARKRHEGAHVFIDA